MEQISGNRRRAREIALQVLYAREIGDVSSDSALRFVLDFQQADSAAQSFAEELIAVTTSHLPAIDQFIRASSEHWEFHRIAAVDRNILRLAICELAYFSDIPERVTINEAIELAKKFSTGDSGRFVNGILDFVAKQLRNEQRAEEERKRCE